MRQLSLMLAIVFVLGTAGVASAAPDRDRGEHRGQVISGDVGMFYGALSPFGTWIDLPPYGEVWVPDDVGAGWQPYTEGHWLYSDDGWTWASDFDWGWAPFHYGRWLYDPAWGWVWLPGDVWGPAWVSWRFGDDFIGWAPLPPSCAWEPGVGLEVGFDFDAIPGRAWVFVGRDDFARGRLRGHFFPTDRYNRFLARSHAVARYAVENGHIVDRGVDVERLESEIHHPIERYRVALGEGGRNEIRGKEIRIYRPAVHLQAGNRRELTVAEQRRATLVQQHLEQRQKLERRQMAEREQIEHRQQEELQHARANRAEALRVQHQAELQQLAQRQQEERQQLLRSYNRELVRRNALTHEEYGRRQMAEQHWYAARRPVEEQPRRR